MEYSRNKSANDPLSPEKFSNNNKNINSSEDKPLINIIDKLSTDQLQINPNLNQTQPALQQNRKEKFKEFLD